jgi:acetate kinase
MDLVFKELESFNIKAIAHRVVHGGPINQPQLITKKLLRELDNYSQLAPLHNIPEIKAIRLCLKKYNYIPQFAIFDTSFHSTIPEKAYMYAIPYEYYQKYKIRKYGFHGQSHAYIAEETAKILKKPINKLKIISCHLGNGCSITAIENGKSIDTSMGFTPLEGLVMGTRAGDIDPATIPFLIEKEHINVKEVCNILNNKSGLLGLSGVSRDVRDLIKSDSKRAKLALDVAIYRLVKYIGAYNLILKGADAIVFTAGIGENEKGIRRKICEYLSPLGIEIDEKKNENNNLIISKSSSKIKILVIPADEELMMVRQTLKRIKK